MKRSSDAKINYLFSSTKIPLTSFACPSFMRIKNYTPKTKQKQTQHNYVKKFGSLTVTYFLFYLLLFFLNLFQAISLLTFKFVFKEQKRVNSKDENVDRSFDNNELTAFFTDNLRSQGYGKKGKR